ncbi:hypothetical protein RclHR1_10230001 [Rhizophagus clarus]|nr:hypothetical protein RclHR1_10230001 [Rhizophagus clarus]
MSKLKVFELFRKAADLGNVSGIGTDIDIQKAFELYQNAANLGNDCAQYNLALIYEKGKEIKKDMAKAIYWYEKSAEQGHESAQENLIILLENKLRYNEGVY